MRIRVSSSARARVRALCCASACASALQLAADGSAQTSRPTPARAPASAPVAAQSQTSGAAPAYEDPRERELARVRVRMAQLAPNATEMPALRLAAARLEAEFDRLEEALRLLAPLGPEHDALRAEWEYRLGRYEDALRHFSEQDPEHALLRVDVLEALARFDEARAALERAAELRGARDGRVLAKRGRMHAREGEHAQAAQAFRAALEADELDLEAWHGLGQALVRSGQVEEGKLALARHRELTPLVDRLQFARQSLELDPFGAANHAQLAEAWRELGRLDAAEASFAQAEQLALARGERAELVAVALRCARFQSEQRGSLERALAILERAAGRVPDARLWVRRGDLLLASGAAAQAVIEYERGAALRPQDVAIAQRLAQARERAAGR
jgi:tetratricopeptide (TPR) repeat protein